MGDGTGRRTLLTAALVCLVTAALLGVLVHLGWTPLRDVDRDVGAPAEAWSVRHPAAVTLLLAIEVVFGTIGTILYSLCLVGALWLTGRSRAGMWVIVVMVGTSVTVTALKVILRRRRPEWDDSVHTLTSFSFPSGHASGIASGMGVVTVLAALYVHRTVLRRTVFVASVAFVVIVGADRILLGVHNLSDVLAGYAVAGLWLFAALAIYPPEPRRHTQRGLPVDSVPPKLA